MTLIDNANDWWRMLSVRAAALWAAIQIAWAMLPADQQMALVGTIIPPERVSAVLAAIAFAHIVASRLTAQPDLHEPTSAP